MDINKIIQCAAEPKPYEKGTASMWTDPYIAKQLLKLHTDPATDIASRKEESIGRIADWIAGQFGKDAGEVLDLGCGPGLYARKLAKKGYCVTGVDFSENSVAYAKEDAKRNGLDIRYICMDYLEMEFSEEFDLAMMIYCDFGVLNPDERWRLLQKIYRALKPGGIFIFDALNTRAMEGASCKKSWELGKNGFWSESPYLCLSESFFYPEIKAVLDQHIVIGEDGGYKLYRFWNHYFDGGELGRVFTNAGFRTFYGYENLLSGGGLCNDEGVTFYKAVK
jgi:2-polyprenyl-3-methyl-5-hydroxy-6-metoxy-1,4-benzoquinol methylase